MYYIYGDVILILILNIIMKDRCLLGSFASIYGI
jgi:hypothetical protein